MSYPKVFPISSLEKVLPDSRTLPETIQELELLQNETSAFQLVVFCDDADWCEDCYVTLKIDSPIREQLSLYTVCFVPSLYPAAPCSDNDYLKKTPGLFPDALLPYDGAPLRMRSGIPQSIWVEVDPAGLPAGHFPVHVELSTRSGKLLDSADLDLKIIGCTLPAQTLHHTEWFHCDCLCDRYHVEMFSDEFFEIARRYVKFACAHGINTLLTPVFTPSLDIEEGGHRRRAQLVGIRVENGVFSFDFSMLERWVRTFAECGVETFEIAHFFTQWGAKYAVEIYAEDNGQDRLLFGWDTPADSPAYADFLAVFLPQLISFFDSLGLKDHLLFHISDEPSLEHIDAYRSDRAAIAPYLGGCPVIDAISDFTFYQQGLIDRPVVACDHIQPFADAHAAHLWTYYCCAQSVAVPNRFIAQPSRRSRVLGVLLYLYRCEGFLHWGYNYWYSQFSKSLIDPYTCTDAGMGFPSGDPFLVYPGPDGDPIPSIRIKVLRDAFNDLRALQLLEQRTGRDTVCSLIRRICGDMSFQEYPRDDRTLLSLRRAVNRAIEETLNKDASRTKTV